MNLERFFLDTAYVQALVGILAIDITMLYNRCSHGCG